MDDKAFQNDDLIISSSIEEELQSNDDASFKQLVEQSGRIAAAAQAEYDKLQNYLQNRQVVFDQQSEISYFELVAQLKKSFEKEIANLQIQLDVSQEKYAKVVAKNLQMCANLVCYPKRIDQLVQLIQEQRENYDLKIAQLRSEIFTPLGNIMIGLDTTVTSDPLTDSCLDSGEEDEGIGVNISATSVVENTDDEIFHSTSSVSASSTPQQPIDDHTVGVADTVDAMPKTSTILRKESSSISGISVHPDCRKIVEEIRKHTKRYTILKTDYKEGEVVVEIAKSNQDIGSNGKDYEDSSKQAYKAFINDLKDSTGGFTGCRFAIFDFHFKRRLSGCEATDMEKLVFINYCSDEAKRKDKMLYASCVKSTTSALHPAITLKV